MINEVSEVNEVKEARVGMVSLVGLWWDFLSLVLRWNAEKRELSIRVAKQKKKIKKNFLW